MAGRKKLLRNSFEASLKENFADLATNVNIVLVNK